MKLQAGTDFAPASGHSVGDGAVAKRSPASDPQLLVDCPAQRGYIATHKQTGYKHTLEAVQPASKRTIGHRKPSLIGWLPRLLVGFTLATFAAAGPSAKAGRTRCRRFLL